MHRNIILEFLSNKHLELSKNSYFQMTLVELGCKYSDTLIKLTKREDLINVYHIKEPRIYQKSYDFNCLESSIVQMVMEINEVIKFNKSDLNFNLLDPYYLKDIREIEFSSLEVYPIYDQKELVGVMITYFNKENGSIKFTNNELLKLITNLKEDREKEYLLNVEQKFVQNKAYYYVCSKTNNYYINDLLQNKLKIDSSIINIKDSSSYKKITNFIKKHGIKKIKFDDFVLYYIEKEKTIKQKFNDEVLAMYNINNHNFDELFSYIMIRKSPLVDNLKELSTIFTWLNGFDDLDYKIYQYNDETFIILCNQIISNESLNYLKDSLEDDYLISINSNKDITKSMNLNKISDYLYNIQPEKFDYQEYVSHIKNNNELDLFYHNNFSFDDSSYEIINVDNVTSLGKIHYLPLREKFRDSHFKSYNSIVKKEIAKLLKIEEDKFMINIPFSLLQKRKVLEDVKKILSNNNQIIINVLYDDLTDYNNFIKVISKYKKLNLLMSCDSSVYLNFYLMPSIELFDFIYVQYEEYDHIRNNNVGIPQAIFSYVIHEYKNLIIENFKPNNDIDFYHPNCYYVSKK